MNNNNFYQVLEKYATDSAVILDNTDDSDVIFSWQYKRKRKAMITAYRKASKRPVGFDEKYRKVRFGQKIRFAVLVAVLAVLFTGAAFGVYTIWKKYQIKDYSLYSMLYISEPQGAPRILEEKYEIGLDLNEYQEIIHTDLEIEFFAEYRSLKSESVITYSQSTYEVGEQTFINTENALVMPCEITINGYEGIYFETYYGGKCIIWCTENYVFSVTGANISKNELISIAESVKKVE